MEKTEKVDESEMPLKCKICLRNFQSQLELENHDIIEHKRNYPPLGVG
jgi:hypothetical protein